jgi:hypothetical protein
MGRLGKAVVIGAAMSVVCLCAIAIAGFQRPETYPAGGPGAQALDVVLGHFQGGVDPDLAVSNRGLDRIAILRGNTGTFGGPRYYPAGPSPLGLLQGDWNGDGRLDLAVANQSAAGGVTIMLRVLDGYSSHQYPAGPGSSFVMAGRFTADQRLDLVVSNLDGSTVSILRGQAGGAFAKIGDVSTGPDPFGLAVADFNGDGKRDFAVTNQASSNATRVSVFRGVGDGTFRPALNSAAGVGANEMAVRRINGDPIPDLAIADFSTNKVDVLIGTGTGRFKAPKTFPAGANPADVAFGDFNGDGKADLAVTNNNTPGRVAILIRKAGLNFGKPIKYSVGAEPYGLAVGPVNADQRLDLITANYIGTATLLKGN